MAIIIIIRRRQIITSIKKNVDKHCWWEYRMTQSLWKSVWQFLKKLNTDLNMT